MTFISVAYGNHHLSIEPGFDGALNVDITEFLVRKSNFHKYMPIDQGTSNQGFLKHYIIGDCFFCRVFA